ncbi:MAG: amino acid ABC transporter permease [Dehalococcoidia bacterium]|nr:amino acid ABC transporter permease [Dehalococcoidia bacterium]MCB9490757.1 amino acid ABC transporter permease [Dehalococcoidia bacterium]
MTTLRLPSGVDGTRTLTTDDARRWLRTRLFNSPANTVISLVLLAVLGWASWRFFSWLVLSANFDVVRANRRLLLVGRFPLGEEWRIWPVLYGFGVAVMWSWGAWGRVTRNALIAFAVFGILVLPIMAGASGTLQLAPAAVLAALAYFAARASSRSAGGRTRAQLVAGGLWFLLLPSSLVLLLIDGGVDPGLWGGVYLNVIVSSGAVIGALPFGILLALGRTSSFRALRVGSTVYIELMRGLPLPVMLTLAWLALRHFLPGWGGLENVDLVYRVTIAFALFTAAFIAEALRGGLNAIPRGQREAASALGLSGTQSLVLIVLPQAVRNSLPALAGEFIGLFMMSTMVAVVGLTDMLQAARATTEQPEFFGRQKEVLLFVGLVFWMTAFGLSRLSSQLERALSGAGSRRA